MVPWRLLAGCRRIAGCRLQGAGCRVQVPWQVVPVGNALVQVLRWYYTYSKNSFGQSNTTTTTTT